MITPIIASIALVAFILIIWFKTTAFEEFLYFTPVVRKFKFRQASAPELDFMSFLTTTYNNIFIRLITCHYCLGFWLSLITGCTLIGPEISVVCLIYVCSMIAYKLA